MLHLIWLTCRCTDPFHVCVGAQPELRGGACEHVEVDWSDEVDADDGVGACPHIGRYIGCQFFRVLHTHPHAWKTVPMNVVLGGKATANHIAVVPLSLSGATADGPLLVSSNSTSGIHMMGDFTSADMAAFQECGQDVLYYGAGADCSLKHSFADLGKLGLQTSHSDLSDVLQQLLSRQALPGGSRFWSVPQHHPSCQTLTKLQLHSLVLGEEGGDDGPCAWRFTHKGVQSLTSLFAFDRPPTSLTSPRLDAPIEDRTHHELLVEMQADGWTWKRLPQGRNDCLVPPPSQPASLPSQLITPQPFHNGPSSHDRLLSTVLRLTKVR
jgi:hypothetical protein